jgi:phosphatidylserine decarboxylase
MEYNFFNLKIISDNIVYDKYLFEIYCNNTNYYGIYNDINDFLIIDQIVVPLYSKYFVLYISNLYNDNFYTYNLLNKTGNYKITIGSNEFYLSVQNNNNLLLNLITINNDNFIDNVGGNKYYYHCELKTIIPEINDDNWTYINSILTNNSHMFKNLRKITTNIVGSFLKSFMSKYIINNFARKFNINIKSFQISKYNSFNDFFIRRLLIEPITIEYNTIFRCPVNGKIITFNDLNSNNDFTIWIKGKNFTIDKLIDNSNKKIMTMIVCRLSIYDYHHFHLPFTGILKNITVVGDDYFSVKPEIIHSYINVLNENYRHIYEFSATYNLTEFTYWIVAVGALVVGSIEHNMIIGNKYLSGERIGNFSLGGSTIVILTSIRVNINDDINYFSSNGIESYVKVGNTIGNLALSDEIIKYPKKYYITNFKNQFQIEKNTFYILKILLIVFLFYLIVKIIKNNK